MEENKKEWPKANGKNSIEIVLISPLALSLGFGCCYFLLLTLFFYARFFSA